MEKTLHSLRNHRYIEPVLKGTWLLLFGILLYYLIADQDFTSQWRLFNEQQDLSRWPLLMVVGSMMLLNWYWESVKWKLLIGPLEEVSIQTSLRAVLVGLATSLFTPNRMGEYLGRTWLAPVGKRWQAAAALFLGSFIQMVLIALLGLMSILHLLNQGFDIRVFSQYWHWLAVGLAAIVGAWAYFNAGKLIALIKKHLPQSWMQKGIRYFLFYQRYSSKDRWRIAWLCVARLTLYSVQYLLLLRFFAINLPWMICLSAILACYFIQTTLPIPPFIALLARGEIALLVWNSLEVNELSLLAASYSLWVINVLLPALVGMILVLNMNILKSFGYGSK